MSREDREQQAGACEEGADADQLVDESNRHGHIGRRSAGSLPRWQVLDHLGDRLVGRHFQHPLAWRVRHHYTLGNRLLRGGIGPAPFALFQVTRPAARECRSYSMAKWKVDVRGASSEDRAATRWLSQSGLPPADSHNRDGDWWDVTKLKLECLGGENPPVVRPQRTGLLARQRPISQGGRPGRRTRIDDWPLHAPHASQPIAHGHQHHERGDGQ